MRNRAMTWDVLVVARREMQRKYLPGTDWDRATLGGVNFNKVHVNEAQA